MKRAEISLSGDCQKVISEVTEISGYLWDKGWAEANGGSVSVDVTDLIISDVDKAQFPIIPFPVLQSELAGRSLLLKVGGARMRDLARYPKKDLMLVTVSNDLRGYHLLWGNENGCQPTSEFISHLKIHDYLRHNNMSQKVILHTHPVYLIALTQIKEFCQERELNKLLFTMHPEVRVYLPDGVGLVSYYCPGSEELAEATVTILQNHSVVLWEKHGCIVVADTPLRAFDLIDIAEKAAGIFFICKTAGFTPQGISDEQLAELESRFHLK